MRRSAATTLPALLATVLLAASAAPGSSAECPSSTYLVGTYSPTAIAIVAAKNDTTFAGPCFTQLRGGMDAATGIVRAEVPSACSTDAFMPPSAIASIVEDDFTVSGLPTGTPVAVTFGLTVTGQMGSFGPPSVGGGRVRGVLMDGFGQADSVEGGSLWPGPTPLDRQLFLTEHVTAGTPFHLRYSVWSQALEGYALGSAQLFVAALSQYGDLTSCRGFSMSGATPAHRTTWGRLKSVYR
jgi:hypothetical protein